MNLIRTLRTSLLALCLCAAPVIGAQTPVTQRAAASPSSNGKTAEARTETVEFESKLVGAPLPYVVVLPPNYDAADARATRYPVIYLLHGFGGNPRNWLGFDLAELAARRAMIFVLVEGRNSFYTDSASVPNDKFESYFVRELIPDVDRRFRTLASREGRAVAGLSMGGYGALKFGVKYPAQFSFAGSMSGALAVASYTRAEDLPQSLRPVLVNIFGTPDGKTKIENDLFRLIREMPAERRAQLPFIYFDCGTEDFLFESNRAFVSLLTETKIPHKYTQLPGGHTRAYWTQQLPFVIDAASRVLASPAAARSAATGASSSQ